MNRTIETISSATMTALCSYEWPGNVRELQNVIERAVILSPGPALVVSVAELEENNLLETAKQNAAVTTTRKRPVRSILADVNRDEIINALREAQGQIGGRDGAASRMGLKRTTFITRMKKLGISPGEVLESREAIADAHETAEASVA